MKHLEVTPERPVPQRLAPQRARRLGKFNLAVLGVALVAGIGFGLNTLMAPAEVDDLTDTQKSALVADFATLKGLDVEAVAPLETGAALDTMRLGPHERRELEAALEGEDANAGAQAAPQSAPPTLVWITLWDFADQDGDVVRLASAGYQVDVALEKTPTRIAVPMDSSYSLQLTGVHDGGGGITLGAGTSAAPTSLPVMTVGQVLHLPVLP